MKLISKDPIAIEKSSMETHYDAYMAFPVSGEGYYTSEYYMGSFDRLVKLLTCVEEIEASFDLEFSCGDDKYLSDFSDDDPDLEQYDGKVCLETPPRLGCDGDLMTAGKEYNFTVKYDPATEEQIFYIDNKERTRRKI